MVQEEVEKTDLKSSKPKWQNVYLTIYEIEGLKEICERFKDWQQALANYPKDLKEDPKDLLERLQVRIDTVIHKMRYFPFRLNNFTVGFT